MSTRHQTDHTPHRIVPRPNYLATGTAASHGKEAPRWKAALAIVLAVLALLVTSTLGGIAGHAADLATGHGRSGADATQMSVLNLLLSFAGIAVMLPVAILLHRWVFGASASIHSITGRFRWGLLARAALLIIPAWTGYVVISGLLVETPGNERSSGAMVAFLAVTILLAPIQAAAEEYTFRGVVMRSVAGLGRTRRSPGPLLILVAIVISAVLFGLMHFATEPWLIAYYTTFGLSMAVIAWRSGGLELSVLVHATNNTVTFMYAELTGASTAIDRSAGSIGSVMAVPMAMMALTAAAVWVWSVRPGRSAANLPVAESATGAKESSGVDASAAPAWKD